jgi:hypothetical protein
MGTFQGTILREVPFGGKEKEKEKEFQTYLRKRKKILIFFIK